MEEMESMGTVVVRMVKVGMEGAKAGNGGDGRRQATIRKVTKNNMAR